MKKFWYTEALCTGNTHWINSIAIKIAILFKAESLWQIRWFSTLSTFTFFVVVLIWIRSIEPTHLKFLIFSVLLLNPYILDYLGLARGYSPGLMFQALALLLFILSLKNNNLKQAFFGLIFSGLSPLSNFSFIYFFMAFAIVYFFVVHFKNGLQIFRSWVFYRDVTYVILISAIVIRAFIFMTICSNDVVGAGTDHFLEYFQVFSQGLLYHSQINETLLNFLSITIFILLALSCMLGIFSRNAKQNRIWYYTSIILLTMLSVTFINRYLFHVVFPYYRSAIFLFPTSAVCFIYMLNKIFKSGFIKPILFYLISSLLALNFILSMNLNSVFDFHIQADLKKSFDKVEALNAVKVGISPELYGGFRNYYQMTDKYHYNFKGVSINTHHPKGLSDNRNELKEFDYLILFPPYNLSYYKNNPVKFKAVEFFKETGTLILKVNEGL
ncbi:hypothetical protein [Aurantibacillus circumpalustris]|uniref:hypothetical protein n=1 Tax=Aurantibacillus circumpalustris TaxID=3036359 RepID=UPI00295BF39A|nr:hypothetical protein [Aurantibacillus circumpalustris]